MFGGCGLGFRVWGAQRHVERLVKAPGEVLRASSRIVLRQASTSPQAAELQAVGCEVVPHPQVPLLNPPAGCSLHVMACSPWLLHIMHPICGAPKPLLCPVDSHGGIQSVEQEVTFAPNLLVLLSSPRWCAKAGEWNTCLHAFMYPA